MAKISTAAGAALLLLSSFGLAQAADAPTAFNQCKACHSTVAGKNGVGPSLFGVYGRKAGMVEGYKYSEAHLRSGLTWDDATLTKYLSNPKQVIPGNKMAFAGIKNPQQTQEVINYLKTLK